MSNLPEGFILETSPQAAPVASLPDGFVLEQPSPAGFATREQRGEETVQDPAWYQKLGSAADDMVRIVANGATLGLADRFAGWAGGKGYEAEQLTTQSARDRAGSAAIAGDVIGMAAPTGAAANLGARAVGAVAPKVVANAGLGMRTAGQAAVGAGIAGTEAAIKGEDVADAALMGAVAGGIGNVAGEALSAGVSKVAGAFNKKPVIPAKEQIEAAKNAAYDASEKAGVIYTPNAMQSLGSKLQKEFAEFGFDPALQPRAAAALSRVFQDAESNVTLKGLDTIRKVASNAYEPGNKANNALVKKVIDGIDDLIANPKPGSVLAGDGAAGAAAIKSARANAATLAKLDQLEYALKKADLRAASTGSGGNVDNAVRQNVRGILEKSRGLTPDEAAAMETVVRGTSSQNMARLVGKASPEGNGLSLMLHLLGGSASGGATLPLAGVGLAAKRYADGATNKNVDALFQIIRAGGSKSATEAAKNAMQRLTEAERQTLINALTNAGISIAP